MCTSLVCSWTKNPIKIICVWVYIRETNGIQISIRYISTLPHTAYLHIIKTEKNLISSPSGSALKILWRALVVWRIVTLAYTHHSNSHIKAWNSKIFLICWCIIYMSIRQRYYFIISHNFLWFFFSLFRIKIRISIKWNKLLKPLLIKVRENRRDSNAISMCFVSCEA